VAAETGSFPEAETKRMEKQTAWLMISAGYRNRLQVFIEALYNSVYLVTVPEEVTLSCIIKLTDY
jgi:hypothetical protein